MKLVPNEPNASPRVPCESCADPSPLASSPLVVWTVCPTAGGSGYQRWKVQVRGSVMCKEGGLCGP